MFTTKKKKILKYLSQKSETTSAFDIILSNYLDGSLKENLSSIGISKTEVHVDWLDTIKCIGIQGRYKSYYMDLQIYQTEFSISFNLDEADEDITFPLECKEQLFRVIIDTIKRL